MDLQKELEALKAKAQAEVDDVAVGRLGSMIDDIRPVNRIEVLAIVNERLKEMGLE